jgi:hypothetical protein
MTVVIKAASPPVHSNSNVTPLGICARKRDGGMLNAVADGMAAAVGRIGRQSPRAMLAALPSVTGTKASIGPASGMAGKSEAISAPSRSCAMCGEISAYNHSAP